MKKYEILYNWLIEEITRLTDSDVAENYEKNLNSNESDNFVSLTEKIRTIRDELLAANNNKYHFTKWAELIHYFEIFTHDFSSFPSMLIAKLKLLTSLADKLSAPGDLIDEGDIDTTKFEIRKLTHEVPQVWFCKENSQSIEDSLVVFSCSNIIDTLNEIKISNMSSDMLYYLMGAIIDADTLPSSTAILVKKTVPQVDISAINAFARLVIIATGKAVHDTRSYVNPPKILNLEEIKSGNSYQQWNDVLNVLSEYNSRKEPLSKFLTIYHVIENFMFKRPIVELERQMGGDMFSIRDFRRLYASVEMNELDALKKLFTKVFKITIMQQVSFESYFISRWCGLIQSISEVEIDSALSMIGSDLSFNGFKNPGAVSFFAKLVYIIRNSIVHNKETEFHLTYATLITSPGLCILIEDFLLPSLEEISFSLIGKPNADFWYQNKEISLYR